MNEIGDAFSLAGYLISHPNVDGVNFSQEQFEILARYCHYDSIQLPNGNVYIIDEGKIDDMAKELGFDYLRVPNEFYIGEEKFKRLLKSISEQKETANQKR